MPPEDPAAEYGSVRHAVGLIDRSDRGALEVTGRDRAAFLHAMLSNDVKALAAGQGCAAALLDAHGKVQSVLVVLALEDRILALTPPGLAGLTLETLDRYLFSEKAALRDATGELGALMLAGPEAPPLVEKVAGAAPAERAWSHTTASIDGIAVRLVTGGRETGEAEIWIIGEMGAHDRLARALIGAGARPVGRAAWEALRIEAGTPEFGPEMGPTVLLPEVTGFERFVSYTKGCYIGQEVVVRIRDRGHVNRHLCGLLVDGDTLPAPGAAVTGDGEEVGRVTSAAWSFGLKRPIALAYVRRRYAEPGAAVAVRGDGGAAAATVSTLPFPR